MHSHHLAQLNVARAKAPLDGPIMAGFVAELQTVNAAAEGAPGFVWRLKDADLYARSGADPQLPVTLSVWESIEALRRFVYEGQHLAAFRRRAEWFERADGPSLVLWWVSRDVRPTIGQAMARLAYLKQHEPSRLAFTMQSPFARPVSAPRSANEDDSRRI